MQSVITRELEEARAIYSAFQAAKIMGVSYRYLLKEIKAGRTPFYKIGPRWRISGERLREYANGEWPKVNEGRE